MNLRVMLKIVNAALKAKAKAKASTFKTKAKARGLHHCISHSQSVHEYPLEQ